MNTKPPENVKFSPKTIENIFYRATLCINGVFAVARCPSFSLSVRLTVTFVHSIQMAEDIVDHLCPPGSPIILVFDPSAGTQFQGEPFQRGRKIDGVGKFGDFRLKSAYISETVRDRPMVTMER